jgi:hypothetical protein
MRDYIIVYSSSCSSSTDWMMILLVRTGFCPYCIMETRLVMTMVSGRDAQNTDTGNKQMTCTKCEGFHLWKVSFNFMSFFYMKFIILRFNAVISALFS